MPQGTVPISVVFYVTDHIRVTRENNVRDVGGGKWRRKMGLATKLFRTSQRNGRENDIQTIVIMDPKTIDLRANKIQ